MKTCTWCKDAFELVAKDGHLICPECHTVLVKKGEPGYDEAWGARIQMDEYWISAYYGVSPEPLVQIQPAKGKP
jgi:DNA-directed RNA polymerase subunit RPC12/RpoP